MFRYGRNSHTAGILNTFCTIDFFDVFEKNVFFQKDDPFLPLMIFIITNRAISA